MPRILLGRTQCTLRFEANIAAPMEQSPTHQPAPKFALSDEQEDGVPSGFRRMLGGAAYTRQLGPLYLRRLEDGHAVLGLRVAPGHLNMQGIAHGGMLTTVADTALGINVALKRGRRAAQVTLTLTTDFLSSAVTGEWLEAWVQVHQLDERLAHAACALRVEDRLVARATTVFSLRDRAFGSAPAAGA